MAPAPLHAGVGSKTVPMRFTIRSAMILFLRFFLWFRNAVDARDDRWLVSPPNRGHGLHDRLVDLVVGRVGGDMNKVGIPRTAIATAARPEPIVFNLTRMALEFV